MFTPNPQDRMVIALRRWLRQHAGGSIPWQSGITTSQPTPPMPRDPLFAVWHTPTQHCSVCLGALTRIRQLIRLSLLLAGSLLVIGMLILATVIPAPAGSGWIVMASALLPALAAWGLQRLAGMFHTYPFEHSRND